MDSDLRPRRAPRPVRYLLMALAIAFLTLFVILPVVNVFTQAFGKGFAAYAHNFISPTVADPASLPRLERRAYMRDQLQVERTWASIRMTLGVAAIAVPLNVIFGIAAAWLIAKFRFRGRSLLLTLIDIPFSVSPVVSGLIFVLLLGRSGWFGNWATQWQWSHPAPTWRGFTGHLWPFGYEMVHYTGIIFTPLATVIATTFITFPFVARNLIPLMEAQGADEELAAATLGAGGFSTFFRVTMPNIRWGLLYGIILCNARAMGEFGAVSVVAGHLDQNNTVPLRVEQLYLEPGHLQAAFAVASMLT
ncbi:MAG: sulfate ABC transporter permease, partial [Phycisphaerae bacterium]|nr:sulfate ABC transporter permease [Phycisphaerae bacterium]